MAKRLPQPIELVTISVFDVHERKGAIIGSLGDTILIVLAILFADYDYDYDYD